MKSPIPVGHGLDPSHAVPAGLNCQGWLPLCLAVLLTSCAGPNDQLAAGESKCFPRDAPIGSNMPSRKCEAPATDEQRAKAQDEARALRDEVNRNDVSRSLKP